MSRSRARTPLVGKHDPYRRDPMAACGHGPGIRDSPSPDMALRRNACCETPSYLLSGGSRLATGGRVEEHRVGVAGSAVRAPPDANTPPHVHPARTQRQKNGDPQVGILHLYTIGLPVCNKNLEFRRGDWSPALAWPPIPVTEGEYHCADPNRPLRGKSPL